MNHRHRAIISKTEVRPFTGCICGIECNPAAHGNVCLIQHCKCGAWRASNVNGQHIETAPWEPSAKEEMKR